MDRRYAAVRVQVRLRDGVVAVARAEGGREGGDEAPLARPRGARTDLVPAPSHGLLEDYVHRTLARTHAAPNRHPATPLGPAGRPVEAQDRAQAQQQPGRLASGHIGAARVADAHVHALGRLQLRDEGAVGSRREATGGPPAVLAVRLDLD